MQLGRFIPLVDDPPRRGLLELQGLGGVLRLTPAAKHERVLTDDANRRNAAIDVEALNANRDLLGIHLLEAVSQERLFRRCQTWPDGTI
jgi:hypothetical protein